MQLYMCVFFTVFLLVFVSLTIIEVGVTGSLLFSTAVSVGVIRVVEVDNGVGVIVCGDNPMNNY